ncbi:UbiA family prenyltransferase [Paracoccus xiamenensis]|uniref:UbiA family prenyltransferase n=1 Tax=Paracoccus xiamenensis TaxID=2714901 RepID=UPI00140C059B|nr:UbiA family prenyltransferase [Paracoccus xiamenensis]NHF73176.1 UbiA family prenyltransferase [Paracoccus xiamenensis]
MNLGALWTYQAERFPLAKTAPLLGVFSAASISASAQMAGRALPHWTAFLAGFVIAMTLFFQMRACDEWKDLEDDRLYRPDRPIPRGLVSLRLILTLGVASMALTALAAGLWHPPVLWMLVLVWVWLAAMTLEFGVPTWLKARPVLYLLSHMAIMPLIDLLLTALEWMPHGRAPSGLWLFLALSFVNGCVLEIGRKLWAAEHEIEGVDSYSRLWGPARAAAIWVLAVALSALLLLGVGARTGAPGISALVAMTGLAACAWAARRYAVAPSPAAQSRVDMLAGLWVFLCYATAGFAPFLARALT